MKAIRYVVVVTSLIISIFCIIKAEISGVAGQNCLTDTQIGYLVVGMITSVLAAIMTIWLLYTEREK